MHFILSILVALSTVIVEPEKPFVIVELFTSEGCSSCPPADRLLSEIVEKEYEDVEVLALSFHVDYWDYIGWKDPYASKDFTNRQRSYARKFHSNQVYTPQMVVDGKHEFVGSDKGKWNRLVSDLSGKKSEYELEVSELELTSEQLSLSIWSTSKENVILNVAVVERSLSQEVNRGENRGRNLSHDNVVRIFQSRQFDGTKNKFQLDWNSDIDPSKASVIVYAQDTRTWEVIGANRASFLNN